MVSGSHAVQYGVWATAVDGEESDCFGRKNSKHRTAVSHVAGRGSSFAESIKANAGEGPEDEDFYGMWTPRAVDVKSVSREVECVDANVVYR